MTAWDDFRINVNQVFLFVFERLKIEILLELFELLVLGLVEVLGVVEVFDISL